VQKAQPSETLPGRSARHLCNQGKNYYYSWICTNLAVYKGNWDPSGRALLLAMAFQEEAVSSSSALCDAKLTGWSTRCHVLTTPRAAAPPFLSSGRDGGRRGHAAV